MRTRCAARRSAFTDEEIAFYDALVVNNNAVEALGDENLKELAREIVRTLRGSVTVDWTDRENVKAQLRVKVKRILRQHGYPVERRDEAVLKVLEQAEALAAEWATA
ncbi:MAG: DUF3387 domain-containing protein [Methanothrix sp.]|nr:type I restriction enzyme endonuclease domain-containing protein [Methanothrix sp.]MCX8206688.1 DUF3387 domain-containing protein [Methanothrix sp.]